MRGLKGLMGMASEMGSSRDWVGVAINPRARTKATPAQVGSTALKILQGLMVGVFRRR